MTDALPDLLTWQPPRSRVSDPETSHIAARDAEKFAGDHHAKILSYLRGIAPAAAHYIAIADGTGLDKHAVGRRLKELREAGAIHIAGTGPLPGTSRKGTLYRIAGAA